MQYNTYPKASAVSLVVCLFLFYIILILIKLLHLNTKEVKEYCLVIQFLSHLLSSQVSGKKSIGRK